MRKDLIKLIITVTFGLLLVGCGSSGKKISSKTSVIATPTPTATATATTDNNNSDNNSSTENNNSNGSGNTTDTSDPLPF